MSEEYLQTKTLPLDEYNALKASHSQLLNCLRYAYYYAEEFKAGRTDNGWYKDSKSTWDASIITACEVEKGYQV